MHVVAVEANNTWLDGSVTTVTTTNGCRDSGKLLEDTEALDVWEAENGVEI